jgi:hypothetical protein
MTLQCTSHKRQDIILIVHTICYHAKRILILNAYMATGIQMLRLATDGVNNQSSFS